MIGANLLAYAKWHARDALVRAFVPAGLFVVLAGMQLAIMARAMGLDAIRDSTEARDQALMVYNGSLPQMILLGALLVGSGFVALDRERGHVRFLFAAPVVAWQYYLARFLIGITLFTAVTTLIPVGFGLIFFRVPLLPVVLTAGTYALLLGSLAMLAGAFTRRDGLIVIGVTLASLMFQGLSRSSDVPRWMELAAAGLPPIDTADRLRSAWFQGDPAATGDVTLVLGYALAMLITALYTIHRAPLVR
jgi:hypothetical protein